MKKVFIPAYNDWFVIIKQSGNWAVIQFHNKQITYNILGLEIEENNN